MKVSETVIPTAGKPHFKPGIYPESWWCTWRGSFRMYIGAGLTPAEAYENMIKDVRSYGQLARKCNCV